MTRRARFVLPAVLAAAAIAAAGCGGAASDASGTRSADIRPTAATQVAPDQSGDATLGAASAPQDDRPGVADVVAEALPSVVGIRVQTSDGQQGQGSGVVIDGDGIILTNNHVVTNAVKLVVSFNDGSGRELPGTVVGTAPDRDLAVVRVDAKDLRAIEIGNSASLRLGDEVIALGYPLGLGTTVTRGIVSGLHREIQPEGDALLHDLIQTDAAINPGNSGGPLVDGDGRLVGLNSAGTTSAENIGFAISIDGAIKVADEILAGGYQQGGTAQQAGQGAWLGVSIAADQNGLVVAQVVPGSPAEAAGLEQGDVIVGLDGRQVASPDELGSAIAAHAPGDRIELQLADGRAVDVELGQRP